MSGFIDELIGGRFAPHGYCLLWDPWLVWTMAVSDTLIALAYFSIPVALVIFVRRRRDIAFGSMFWLFALFIMACGLTHVAALWNLWNGAYAMEAAIKALTAAASVLTAIMLWPLLPRAIALPSPEHLRTANAALRAEIIEREKAEAALLQARKMEAMGQLTGGIAHDFNNLLQVVAGSLDIINGKTREDSHIQRLCDAAITAVERGRRLTGQLLSFSRVQRIELRPVALAPMLRGLKEMLSRTIDPSIRIDIQEDATGEAVTADPVQLELALLNLALNARDAMPRGGTLTISLESRRIYGREGLLDGDYVAIRVADTGIGMSEEVMARAFEPFFTTKPVGQGSGLGLSMVFGMAQQSGGTVKIESRQGEGTTIIILLRSVAAEPEAEPLSEFASQERADALAGLHVLVVDDEPGVREIVTDMLNQLGCRVTTAGSGEDALALLDRAQPQAVLLDFAMPGMNGADLAEAVLARRPETRIVFATGYAQSSAIEAVLGDRAIVLRKPFSPHALVEALQAAMAD
jgi:signal transduction histidine kinase